MVQGRKPPSQTWRTFLENHVKDLVSVDFFVVPTVRFAVLYVFVVLAHDRRRVLHFNVTANPTARWTAQQITDAFPVDESPRYLLRDRDGVYGGEFRGRARNMGIEEVLTAPRSPWQSDVRGARDRQHSARLSGPRRRHEREARSADSDRLLRLLSPFEDSPVAGDGLSGAPARPGCASSILVYPARSGTSGLLPRLRSRVSPATIPRPCSPSPGSMSPADSALIVMRHPASTVSGGVHDVFFGAHGGSRTS